MNPIGIMQGRLLPPVGGKIQAFPVDGWRHEFTLAAEAGLNCIEWIYEADSDTVNPLSNDKGVEEIQRIAASTDVAVTSVTADYYMAHRLVSSDGAPRAAIVEHLKWLLGRASLLEARYVMAPFVDRASLRTKEEVSGLLSVLEAIAPTLEEVEVELHMETDLDPAQWAGVLEHVSHPAIRVCYDIGDRASLGYDPAQDFRFLGPWLGSVHVKDRPRGGATVPLGTGAADFSACFSLIADAGFPHPFILQAARGEAGNERETAARNIQFVREHVGKLDDRAAGAA